MLTVGMISLGCPKNLVDTENVLGNLKKYNIGITSKPEDADIIVINTCGFIQSAKEEAINTILEMSQYKENGKCKKLIVIGCLAERYKDEIIKEMPEVDLVFGLKEYDKLISTIVNEDTSYSCDYRLVSTPSYMAYLKIADGCDNCCTYCAIPMIRGKYISRPKEEIIAEANDLAKNGVSEIVLVAQDTTRYGIDLYKKYELANLLRELCKIDGIKWIRILYTYPELISDELIEVIRTEPKVCNYLDIPLQHINNDILRNMNRKSTKDEIYNLLDKLRRNIPDIAIRTSLIVGFPGETEDNFNELEQFVKDAKFDRLGVFQYSPEEDTPAANFDGQIVDEVKEARYNKIMEVQQEISTKKNEGFIGKDLEVLIEGKINKTYVGRTYRDTKDIDSVIYVTSDNKLEIGKYYTVNVTKVSQYDLYGKT